MYIPNRSMTPRSRVRSIAPGRFLAAVGCCVSSGATRESSQVEEGEYVLQRRGPVHLTAKKGESMPYDLLRDRECPGDDEGQVSRLQRCAALMNLSHVHGTTLCV